MPHYIVMKLTCDDFINYKYVTMKQMNDY
jgi:hypothetical protein